MVWDEYIADSLKELYPPTGRTIQLNSRDWQEFLRINDNKTELFSFLATSAATIATDIQVISTCHTGLLCTQSRDVSGVAPCTHEEADTRILLHMEDALKTGITRYPFQQLTRTWLYLQWHQLNGSTSPNCGLPLVWKELSLFTGPRDGQRTGSWSLCCFANVSCLH